MLLGVALLSPSLAMLFPTRIRHGVLTATLFLLATISGLIAASPGAGMTLAVLHPVLLAGALSNGAPRERRHPSAWHDIFPARTALFGLWLGMPAVSWVALVFNAGGAFHVAALATLLSGAWWMLRDGARSIGTWEDAVDHGARGRLPFPRHASRWLVGPLSAIALMYAALFSVFSHAHAYLESGGKLDASSVSFLLVVFGIGGVFGAFALTRWRHDLAPTVMSLHPMALAATYLLLFLFGRTPGMASFAVIFLWGAVHTAGMLMTRPLLSPLAHRRRDVAAALHITAAAVGALAGVAAANCLGRVLGVEAFVICGSLLSLAAFVVVSTQLAEPLLMSAIVAKSRTE